MGRLSLWPAVFGLALAMIVVTLIQPVENSLAFASASIVLISLLGWVFEARALAGPPPEVAPEHEEEEKAPGPSYWPLFLALGVVGIAAGLVYSWQYGALIVAVPLALAASAAWLEVLRQEIATSPGLNYWPVATFLVTVSTILGTAGLAVGFIVDWDTGLPILLSSLVPAIPLTMIATGRPSSQRPYTPPGANAPRWPK